MSTELRATGFALFSGIFVVGATFLLGKVMMPSPNSYAFPKESPAALNADVTHGEKSYQQFCARCHADDASGNDKRNVPSLVDEDMTDGDQVVEIEYGENRMPAFDNQLTTKQIESIVRYLRTL